MLRVLLGCIQICDTSLVALECLFSGYMVHAFEIFKTISHQSLKHLIQCTVLILDSYLSASPKFSFSLLPEGLRPYEMHLGEEMIAHTSHELSTLSTLGALLQGTRKQSKSYRLNA